MKDYYAAFPLYSREHLLALKSGSLVVNSVSLIDLLAQTIASEDSRSLGREQYAQFLNSADYRNDLREAGDLLSTAGLGPPARLDLTSLPEFSFFLRADFTLETPYLSRDDRVFSVTENPVRKDWVFRLPLIASTTWKGALRNACLMQAPNSVGRLFGPEPSRHSQEEQGRTPLHEGRVCTFPSFFSQIASEIINPHDRKRRVGKNPIRMECVPRGARSRLALLYLAIPRDDASWKLSQCQLREQIADDLVTTANCVRSAMREYGFSAKKSSGYGAAADGLSGEGGLIEIGGLGTGVTFSKFSEIRTSAEALAAKIRGSL